MVRRLHEELGDGVKLCFETKIRKKKTTEPVWMTDEIRSLIAKRRRLFKRVRRKEDWIHLKNKISLLVEKRKKGHSEYVRQKFISQKDTKNFHHSISSIMKGAEEEHWDVRCLYPGQTDGQVAENLADFFNSISSEYVAMDKEAIPTSYESVLPELTEFQVSNRLRKNKKCTSTVPGDVPPVLYNHYASLLGGVP